MTSEIKAKSKKATGIKKMAIFERNGDAEVGWTTPNGSCWASECLFCE